MKRKKVVMIIIGIMTVLIGICLYSYSRSFQESYRLIKLVECHGNAEVKRDGIGIIEAYKNMNLKNKDYVFVHEGATAVLQLDNDKYVYVEPNTEFRIEAVGDENNSKTKIILEKGGIISEIQESLEKDETYEVETPNSTMSVRGTVFRVNVYFTKTGESYTDVQVFDGKVGSKLIYPDGSISKDEVLTSRGLAVKIHGNEELSEYVITMINGKEQIVTPINYEDLPLESLIHLKAIIENQKNDVVISLKEVEDLIQKAKSKQEGQNEDDICLEDVSTPATSLVQNQNRPLLPSTTENEDLPSEIIIEPDNELNDESDSELDNEPIQYNIHFYSDGVNVKTQQAKAGEKLQLPVLNKQGYIFDGWYNDQNYQSKVSELIAFNDRILYAKWTPKDDTKVNIHHYVKKRGHTNYELVKTEEETGRTGDTFLYQNVTSNQPITINQLDSCIYVKHEDEVVSGTITAENPLVIKIYYDQWIQVNYHDFNNQITTVNYPYGAILDTKDIPALNSSKDGYFQSIGWFDKEGNSLSTSMVLQENIDFYEMVNYQYKIEYYEMDFQNGTYSQPVETETYYQKEGTYIDIRQKNDILNKYIKEGYEIDLQKSVLESTVDSKGEMVLKVYYKTKTVTVTFYIKNQGTNYTETRQVAYQYGEKFEKHSLKSEDIYQELSQEDYKFHGWKDKQGQIIENDYIIKEDMECYEDIEFAYKLIASVQEVDDGTKYQDYLDIYIMKYGYVGEEIIITGKDLENLNRKLESSGILPVQHGFVVTGTGNYGIIKGTKNIQIVKYNRKIYTWTLIYNNTLDLSQNKPDEKIEFRYGAIPNINGEKNKYSSLTEEQKKNYQSIWYSKVNAKGDEDKIGSDESFYQNVTCYEIPRKRVNYFVSYFYEGSDNRYHVDIDLSNVIESYDTATIIATDHLKEGFDFNEDMSRKECKIDKDFVGSQCVENIDSIDQQNNNTNILWMFYKRK